MPRRVAILISGSGSNMVSLIKAMAGDPDITPVLVISNRASAAGLDRAAELGVPTLTIDHANFANDRLAHEEAIQSALDEHSVDFICLAGFMRILSPGFIKKWPGKILNIHPSLLPKFKGLHTHERALAAGETYHGCSVHVVTASLDDGPILGQARCRIEPEDTPKTLAARVLPLEHKLYPAVLARFIRGDSSPVFLDG